MEVLNYENIKNEIEGFYKERIKIERKVEDEYEIEEILTSIFPNNDPRTKTKDFCLIELTGDVNVLKYIAVDKETKKETEVIILVKNNKPLFKLERHKQRNKETEYVTDSYYTYEEESNYLISRINIETLSNDAFKTSTVKVLNRTQSDARTYYRKEYTFYINNGKIISFRTDDKMYLEQEPNFENMLTPAIKLIDKTSMKIITHLENTTLEDNVKEYKIHRKNK